MRDRLNKLHDDEKLSWRKIAALPEYSKPPAMPAGSLCSYAKGTWTPKRNDLRRRYGEDVYETIEVRRGEGGRFAPKE